MRPFRAVDFKMLAAIGLMALGAAACGAPFAPPDAGRPPDVLPKSERGHPLGEVAITRQGEVLAKFEVEIAVTPQALATGLMHVEELAPDAGMAFLFGQEVQHPFYMKNTLIPLDIAFWDANGSIVDILSMEPCAEDPCTLYTPSAMYVGALEVNAGRLEDSGVRKGDVVELKRQEDPGTP